MITLEFIPHSEIEGLPTGKRIKKLLDIAKENKIVLLEGQLGKDEETELIKATMTEINERFKGVELAVLYPDARELDMLRRLKVNLANMLLGGNRQGLTIIGPAAVVKEIKKNPNKIQLFTKDASRKGGKR